MDCAARCPAWERSSASPRVPRSGPWRCSASSPTARARRSGRCWRCASRSPPRCSGRPARPRGRCARAARERRRRATRGRARPPPHPRFAGAPPARDVAPARARRGRPPARPRRARPARASPPARPTRPRPARRRVGLALGACGYALQAGCYFAALERIDASLLSLLIYTFPAIVAAAAIALGRERADSRRLGALIVASRRASRCSSPGPARARSTRSAPRSA